MKAMIEEVKEKLAYVESENQVHPSISSRKELARVKKELATLSEEMQFNQQLKMTSPRKRLHAWQHY